MSTLTIELSNELAARLSAASERARVSPAQFVREALEKTLPLDHQKLSTDEPSLYELMKGGFGCVSSGLGDLATNPAYMEGYGRSRGA